MQKLWFITNPASGSATKEKCEALEAVFAERGLSLAGRTQFPDQDLPDAVRLDAEGVDTVVLFAGDGTINAALCKLADWNGGFLILPGGTMNLLAKVLHADLDPHAIVHAAAQTDRRVALPYVEAGPYRAFVGLILGPATNWSDAREAVRKGHMARLWPSVRKAWQRTFGRGIRVEGAPGLPDRYQAVMVTPHSKTDMIVAAIDARDWRSIVELGWSWLTDDWVAAGAVTDTRATTLRMHGKRSVQALFDGEPVSLEAGNAISCGITAERFITTGMAQI